MNRIYIDSQGKNTTIDLPQYGEVRIIVKDGKVIRTEVTKSELIDWVAPPKNGEQFDQVKGCE